jgi:RNA polymerase sigma factor (sigma-70 family)
MKKTEFRQLRKDFEEFYTSNRCTPAPPNPRRIFNLCYRTIYPRYRRRLTEWDFLAVVFETLGVREGYPCGLFQKFDPLKYQGKLSLEDHFINLFAKQLRGRLSKACRPASDRGRRGNPVRFLSRPELGLLKDGPLSSRDRDLIESVSEALGTLEGVERLIISLTYWGDLTNRKIAVALGIDPKTVRSKHDKAIRRLRVFYEVPA